MGKKTEGFTLEELVGRLSRKEKKILHEAIKNKVPVLFTGEGGTGKTTLAKELRKQGVTAYAPENICIIELGVKKK